MELPKAARVVGTMEDKRVVYLEDYVLQYLAVCRGEETQSGGEMILYGKKEIRKGTEIYIIYGIDRQEENIIEKERKSGFRSSDKGYRRLGYLHPETGAIILDDWKEGEALQGYYVFYDADETMKDCLGDYYGRQLRKDRHNSAPGLNDYDRSTPGDLEEENASGQTAELVALSSINKQKGGSPFLWIRIVVAGIFIIFCAIAVLTVNNYDKLCGFIQTAVFTQEIMDMYGED